MDGKQHLVHGETTNMFYSIMPSPNRLGKDAEMIYGDCGGFLFFSFEQPKKPPKEEGNYIWEVFRCQQVSIIFRSDRVHKKSMYQIYYIIYIYIIISVLVSHTYQGFRTVPKTIPACNMSSCWKSVTHAWVCLIHGPQELGEAGCSRIFF